MGCNAGLQALYEKYSSRGLVVLGFPCNQFGGQEAGTLGEIKAFCTRSYHVTFPMFAKVRPAGTFTYCHYGKNTDGPAGWLAGWLAS